MKRQDRRAANTAANRAAKVRRSRGPADQASIAFDDVRRIIEADGDLTRRDNRWKRVARLLDEFAGELLAGDRQ